MKSGYRYSFVDCVVLQMNWQLREGAKHWVNPATSSRWWMVIASMPLTFRIGTSIERVSVLFCEDIYTDSVSSEKATEGTEMDQTDREWRTKRVEKLKGSSRGTRACFSDPRIGRKIGRSSANCDSKYEGMQCEWVLSKTAVNYRRINLNTQLNITAGLLLIRP